MLARVGGSCNGQAKETCLVCMMVDGWIDGI
jgi:hypothetical protein